MKKLLLAVSICLFFGCLQAQSLLKDIKADNGSSHPRQMIDINGTVFFLAKTNNGETVELWKSNGTDAGTALVKSPYTGLPGPFFPNTATPIFFKFNDKLVFSATDGQFSQNHELWITDGTAAGTQLLKDINPGSSGSAPNTFVQLGATFLFKAYSSANGEELWVSDGTANGTQLCKDIHSGASSSFIRGFTLFNGKAFFYATEPNTGTELWMTDGTTAGTVAVTDVQLNPGGSLSTIDATLQLPVATSTHLYFPVANSVYGKALFSYSTTGFIGLAYQNPSPGGNAIPKELTLFNDRVYFNANYDNIASHRDLFRTDPNDYAKFALSAYGNDPKDLTVANGKLFFTADDFNNRRELYQTDGTSSTVTMVKDINPAATAGDVTFPTEADKRIFIGTPGRLYFIANNGTAGFELWSSDGTSAGTNLIKDFITGSGAANYSYFQAVDSDLFFIANDTNLGYKGWKTNGTLAGTQTVESITPALSITNVYPLKTSGSTFFFSAFSNATGYELYKLSGGAAALVKDIKTGGQNNGQNFLKVTEGTAGIFFTYDNGKDGLELWKTDGTRSGTQLFYDFYSYPLSAQNPYRQFSSFDFYSNSSLFNSEFVWFNNKMYFFVNQQLWVTDGVNPPTVFKTIQSNNSSNAYSLAVYNGALYFNIANALWKTDGTEAGTVLVKNLETGSAGPPLSNFSVAGNLLFFSGYNSTYGEEIWRSNGTESGTFMTKELIPGANFPNLPSSFKVQSVGNILFFTFYDPMLGSELWKTDGTEAGTVLVKDIAPGAGYGPEYMTNFNNQYLIFSGNDTDLNNPNDNGSGAELWKSDGTAAGTQMIKDLNPALGQGSNPVNVYQNRFAVFNNKVYFATDASGGGRKLAVSDLTPAGTFQLDIASSWEVLATAFGLVYGGYESSGIGYEPYFSEGNTQNTVLLKDIAGGSTSSSPGNFYHAPLRKIILFLANDGSTGTEIHVVKDCRIQAAVSGTLTGNSQTAAHRTITSTAKLSANSNTTFAAGSAVLLTPGFETTAVNSFSAQITGCTYSTTGPAPLPGN